MKTAVLAFLIALLGPVQLSSASQIALEVVENSAVAGLFEPWEAEISYYSAEALEWDVSDYRETLKTYYALLYSAVLHNELEKASRYLGVLLSLLLRAKGYCESDGPSLLAAIEDLDWTRVKVMVGGAEEIIDWWLLYEPESVKDFAYAYACVALSLLDKLPANSFIRVLHAPWLREAYLASFASILAASTYFVYRKSRLEGENVEAEAPP